MVLRWFVSRTVRQTAEMCRQMKRLLNEQRDVLKPEEIAAISAAREEALAAIRAGANPTILKQQMKLMENSAMKWFKPYWQPALRENVKELLVAIVTILAFTTFFLQLTKIPTGSMQPTLFGITFTPDRARLSPVTEANFQMPGFLQRFYLYWAFGVSYKELIAPEDGVVERIEPLQTIFPFVKKQRILFNRQWLTVWLAPERFDEYCSNNILGKQVRRGEPIVRVKVVSGDHLLVDRLTYNFRPPQRGEIIVFKTRGIRQLDQNVLYIKRLVGMPGEEVRISNDGHLIINNDRLDASDRHFEQVYTMDDPTKVEHPFLGHANEYRAKMLAGPYYRGPLAALFNDETESFKIREKHYMAMGDNTMNSLDSRSWGDFPQKNVIGRCWFVYWPFTERFGWGYR